MKERRQKPPLQRIERLVITDMADEGRAVGRADEKVCFVEGAVPGDVVDVEVYRNKHRYMYARVVHIHTASASRATPRCVHFGLCGGCKWQHLDYGAQLYWKGKQVHDALVRLGKLEISEVRPALPAPEPYSYRNKLEFTATRQRWLSFEEMKEMNEQESENGSLQEGMNALTADDSLCAPLNQAPSRMGLGFHLPGRFDKVMHVQECHLMDQKSNDIRNYIHLYAQEHGWTRYNQRTHEGFLRTLTLRNSSLGQWMLLLMVAEENEKHISGLMSALVNNFPWITSLQYVVNLKKNDTLQGLQPQVWKGPAYIEERMGDLNFHISPESFFQTNSRQAQRLYDLVAEWASPSATDGVYDLYSGTGTIGLFLARKAAWVVGLEYTESAVEDARRNAERNGIHNARFVAGDLKNLLTEDFLLQNGRPSVLITDPPRSGMHPDVVNMLCRMRVPRIVYVSCNPATQARDLDLMRDTYRVERYQPVDMFPQTNHVENVVELSCV
jgi:23S rRNA (uracil1939-C5)-methyltransferase